MNACLSHRVMTVLIGCLGFHASWGFDPSDPPVHLITAAAGLSLGKAQRNGQWICISGIPSEIILTAAGTPWVEGQKVSTSLIPYVSGNLHPGRSLFKVTLTKSERHFKGNGIPSHKIGQFPVQKGTPAYSWYASAPAEGYSSAAEIPVAAYDLDISVPRHPAYSSTPYCINSLITGVATQTGAVWHANLAYGTDWVDPIAALPMDQCWGHPYNKEYHYHGYSWKCLPNPGGRNSHSPLYGYAMDGFGIFGPRGDQGRLLTNADLDECHGHVGKIRWDGKMQMMYHYHLNSEYPYGPGCYRGKPNSAETSKIHRHGFPTTGAQKFPPRDPMGSSPH